MTLREKTNFRLHPNANLSKAPQHKDFAPACWRPAASRQNEANSVLPANPMVTRSPGGSKDRTPQHRSMHGCLQTRIPSNASPYMVRQPGNWFTWKVESPDCVIPPPASPTKQNNIGPNKIIRCLTVLSCALSMTLRHNHSIWASCSNVTPKLK